MTDIIDIKSRHSSGGSLPPPKPPLQKSSESAICDLSSMASIVSQLVGDALLSADEDRPRHYYIPNAEAIIFAAYHLEQMINKLQDDLTTGRVYYEPPSRPG
jgi:hypothetical protein